MSLPLLSSCELADLQAAAELSLDTPITITPITARTPTTGGWTETPGTVIATKARFARPSAPLLTQFAEKVSGQQVWVMSYPSSVNGVKPGDSVTITAGAQSGSVYIVHAPLQPQSFSFLNAVLIGRAL